MFLWNDSFQEDPFFRSPGLLLCRLQALPAERVVGFAAACTLHGCNHFHRLEQEGIYRPFHADLTRLVAEAARAAWQAAAADPAQVDLAALAAQVTRLARDHPEHPRKKCNEDELLLAATYCLRSAQGGNVIREAALAAKTIHAAVCKWFTATHPDIPKTQIGRAQALAVQRGVPQCVEEIDFQKRCLAVLEARPGTDLPDLADLIRV